MGKFYITKQLHYFYFFLAGLMTLLGASLFRIKTNSIYLFWQSDVDLSWLIPTANYIGNSTTFFNYKTISHYEN
jgi:hypothetical protein